MNQMGKNIRPIVSECVLMIPRWTCGDGSIHRSVKVNFSLQSLGS